MQIDYLVVGQGIAGSILSDHMIDQGLSIQVISDPSLSNSSQVAGGLYNPVTGRNLVKTWNCDQLFSYLIPYYQRLEKKLKSNFLRETPIYRPFINIEAQNEWMGKSSNGSFDEYVETVYTKPFFTKELNDPFGGVLLKKSGYVNTATLVESFKTYLMSKGVLRNEVFNYDHLNLRGSHIEYKGIRAKKIIFCEGQQSKMNPFFDWLPFKPVKGELLLIETDHQPNVIYNRGVFIIHLGNGLCKVGATYDNNYLTNNPTDTGKNELKRKLRDLVKFSFSIVDQKAGIRPATKDRRPFMGRHPENENIFIFNGLGAKGVSLAPFYANQMVEYLLGRTKLDKEVNIERYFSLH